MSHRQFLKLFSLPLFGLSLLSSSSLYIESSEAAQKKGNALSKPAKELLPPELSAEEVLEEYYHSVALVGDFNRDGAVDDVDFKIATQRNDTQAIQDVLVNYGQAHRKADLWGAFLETLYFAGITEDLQEPQDLELRVCSHRLDLLRLIQTSTRGSNPGLNNLQQVAIRPVPCDICHGPRNARVAVLKDGYLKSLDADGNPQVEEVCVGNLGQFDPETGLYIANHYNSVASGYLLDGKYLETRTFLAFGEPAQLSGQTAEPFAATEPDDFTFADYFAGTDPLERTNLNMWAGTASIYYHIDRFRTKFFNNQFINSLQIPDELKKNLKHRQFRPDLLVDGAPMVHRKPLIGPAATTLGNQQGAQFLDENWMSLSQRSMGGSLDNTQYGTAFDPDMIVGEYGGVFFNWLNSLGVPFSYNGCEGSGWPTGVTACMEDATNLVLAAWYKGGESEIYKDRAYNIRKWCEEVWWCEDTDGVPALACEYPDIPGNGILPCDRGYDIDNVMMATQANPYPSGYIPAALMPQQSLFTYPFSLGTVGGNGKVYPAGQEKTALFFAALFYDFANEVGMGWTNAARLWFQKLHRIDGNDIRLEDYGATIMMAAEDLWPSAQYPLLHEALFQAITSRGIPLNGVQYFWENLPPTIGEPANFPGVPFGAFWEGRKFGTFHPRSQAAIVNGAQSQFYSPGNGTLYRNAYRELDTDFEYMAYTFYKHSKMGPADDIILTDGSFLFDGIPGVPLSGGDYDGNGTYYIRLTKRQPGNLTVLVPMDESRNRQLQFTNRVFHCTTEEMCSRFTDQSPFGYRVIQSMKNGFSFTSERLQGNVYRLKIEDPSLEMSGPRTGAASYTWEITDQRGRTLATAVETHPVGGNQIEGYMIRTNLPANQPIKIKVTRNRAGYAPDVLEKVERANDLDRDTGNGQGRALVRNCLQMQAADGLCL